MRLRNIPRAEGVIQMHRTVIKRPEDQRGCWHQVFGDRHPIYIEIGMGKGQFILNMAKAHPDVNFIGIERYSSVLLRALEKFDTEEYEALTNIRFVCMDARNVEEVFAPEEVDKIYNQMLADCEAAGLEEVEAKINENYAARMEIWNADN